MRLWLLVGLCGCNQLYDLDETTVEPPMADVDEDGTADLVDNCPGVANDEQLDRDEDGFGDACDFCPDKRTVSNHDEDRDARGDDCDVCPVDPDFQMDADKDGVGDICDNDFANPNRRLLFDPFLDLASWEPTGMWSMLGDAVASGSSGGTLDAPSLVITGGPTNSFELRVGVTATAPLAAGDRFGVLLVDNGTVVSGCIVACTPPLNCNLSDQSVPVFATADPNKPVVELVLRRNPYRQVCIYTDVTDDPNPTPVSFARGTVQLVGTPKIQFRYISVTQ